MVDFLQEHQAQLAAPQHQPPAENKANKEGVEEEDGGIVSVHEAVPVQHEVIDSMKESASAGRVRVKVKREGKEDKGHAYKRGRSNRSESSNKEVIDLTL